MEEFGGTVLLPVFLLLSVSLAEIRLICGGAGHKGYVGDHNCIRSFFSQLFGADSEFVATVATSGRVKFLSAV